MVALLFTAIFIVGLLAITLYFWAPRANSSEQGLLTPTQPPRGLFTEKDAFESAVPTPPADPEELETKRRSLIERAQSGDHSALDESNTFGNQKFYDEVLDQLTATAGNIQALLALASYVTRNELRVNRKLAEAIISDWKNAPDRVSTPKTLHIAALVDDADLYSTTVEAGINFWRHGLLADVSAAELRALFDGEFWVLSARTRSSGAGFILKRKLASARRELETAMR
ncbi:MAG: hypothetical protein ABJC10_14630, partial [Acidobacteriota bacterium]